MQKPPIWCKNAIATDRGWVNPITGEVVVSNRHLENTRSYVDVLEEIVKGVPVKSEKRVLLEKEDPVQEVLEEVVHEVVKPSRRRRS